MTLSTRVQNASEPPKEKAKKTDMCVGCNNLGHFAEHCGFTPPETKENNCTNYKKKGHFEQDCWVYHVKKKVNCTCCKQLGHLEADCWDDPIAPKVEDEDTEHKYQFRRCEEIGHLEKHHWKGPIAQDEEWCQRCGKQGYDESDCWNCYLA